MTDEKPCEVLVDGQWLPGVLLGWTRRDARGQWIGLVTYAVMGDGNYMQARPASEIREAPNYGATEKLTQRHALGRSPTTDGDQPVTVIASPPPRR